MNVEFASSVAGACVGDPPDGTSVREGSVSIAIAAPGLDPPDRRPGQLRRVRRDPREVEALVSREGVDGLAVLRTLGVVEQDPAARLALAQRREPARGAGAAVDADQVE